MSLPQDSARIRRQAPYPSSFDVLLAREIAAIPVVVLRGPLFLQTNDYIRTESLGRNELLDGVRSASPVPGQMSHCPFQYSLAVPRSRQYTRRKQARAVEPRVRLFSVSLQITRADNTAVLVWIN